MSSRLAGDAHGPADGLHHALDDIEANPTPGDLGDLFPGGESWQEDELQHLRLGQSFGHVPWDEVAFHGTGAEPLDIDPPTVIGDQDLEHPGAVAGLEDDRAGRGLSGGDPLPGGLDAVVDGITDEVRERGFEFVEDVAVDAGLIPTDLESDLSVE